VWPILLTLPLALACAHFAYAAGAFPGVYPGKGKGVKAKLTVNDQLEGLLAYKVKSKCGKTHGKIELAGFKNGAYKGKRISAGPHSTLRKTTTRIVVGPDGSSVKGLIRDALSGAGPNGPGDCRAKRKFKATLGKTEAFVPKEDDGHYSGQSADGLPIVFDVLTDAEGKTQITGLSADVLGECYSEDADEDVEESMVVHLSDLSGTVDSAGSAEIDFTPDEDTEFAVDGELGDGEAKLEVSIDGYFDAAGNPDPASDIYCDNWGVIYHATQQ
jgi:hypothetical protein